MTGEAYANVERCSDEGASLGDINLSDPTSTENGDEDDGTKNDVDDEDVGVGPNQDVSGPSIPVLGWGQREKLIAMAFQSTLVEEVFFEQTQVKSDEKTFRIILLGVGLLLIIVAGLMFLNTYVTKKHMNNNTLAHAQIRAAL